MSRTASHLADERGSGGSEVLPFGVLVFVVGTLLVANAWAVVDATFAVSAAAREAARAYVESPDGASAAGAARAAAEEAITGHGRRVDRMSLTLAGGERFHRCARVTVEVSYDVPVVALPWGVGFSTGPITARARHSELVDPYRSRVPLGPGAVEARCG